jgi:iron complex transport system ATP-binding protein
MEMPLHRTKTGHRGEIIVGFVPQGQRTAFPFSCFDVVLTGRHAFVPVYLTPTTTDETIAMQALTDVGAGFLADRPYTRISGENVSWC